MRKITMVVAATMLALSLVACTSQAGQSQSGETAASEQANFDISSWKTLGDALAADPGTSTATSYNQDYYIVVFDADNVTVRAVAKLDAGMKEKIDELDFNDEEFGKKLAEAIGGAELVSVEDLSSQKLTQEQLDALVGKTGQDLLDDGFVFESYWMYGGPQTGATMAKGMLAYDITFDATVSEDSYEDGGASLKDAVVAQAYYAGGSADARDPNKVV